VVDPSVSASQLAHAIGGPLSPEEPALLAGFLNFVFLLVSRPLPVSPHPSALRVASDLVSPVLTMIYIRADRCIDLNDHGQSRGRVILREAAGWPW
jgi:hypothetical protein